MQGSVRQVLGVLFGGDGRVHLQLPAALANGVQLPNGVAMVIGKGQGLDQFRPLLFQGVENCCGLASPAKARARHPDSGASALSSRAVLRATGSTDWVERKQGSFGLKRRSSRVSGS